MIEAYLPRPVISGLSVTYFAPYPPVPSYSSMSSSRTGIITSSKMPSTLSSSSQSVFPVMACVPYSGITRAISLRAG